MSKSKRARRDATKKTDKQRRDEILVRAFEFVDTFSDFCNCLDGSTCSPGNNDRIADVLLSIDWTSNPAMTKRLLIAIVDSLPENVLDTISDEIEKALHDNNSVRNDLARDEYESVRLQLRRQLAEGLASRPSEKQR